jgi:hypothetical protein
VERRKSWNRVLEVISNFLCGLWAAFSRPRIAAT